MFVYVAWSMGHWHQLHGAGMDAKVEEGWWMDFVVVTGWHIVAVDRVCRPQGDKVNQAECER